jgi:hypothetical protein
VKFLVWIALFLPVWAHAQKTIVVHGRITATETGVVPSGTMIIIKHKGTGSFAGLDGSFSLKMSSADTLLITARSYEVQRFTFDDTKDSVYLDVKLSIPTALLRPVIVKPKRPVSEIHDDLSKMRKELPAMPSGSDALQSPITALYSRFGKMSRSKQLVAEMEYQDQKRDLLKELFRLYVDADIIALSPDEFDDFIAYCNPGDSFLRTAKEHELISYFQGRFRMYVNRFVDE